MNNIYCFSWSWYEDYQYYLLTHKVNKTKEEFAEDCKKAIREVGEKYFKAEKSGWIGAPDWIDLAQNKMIEYGYMQVETIDFGHFGSYIIGDTFAHDKTLREDDLEWKKIVGDELFNKAIEHNRKVAESLDK